MPNLFEVLSLDCSLGITVDEVDSSWRVLCQAAHPDIAGESGVEISANLNEARDGLSHPVGLLKEWLKVKTAESAPRNAALSEGLMSLFSSVGEVLRVADESIESLKKAQTALAKSLLTPAAILAQQAVQGELGKITVAVSAITDRFPDFESQAEAGDFSDALAALGELKFLDKWQKECQQRLLELIAIY